MPLPSLAGFEGNGWALAAVLLATVMALGIRQYVPWVKAASDAAHQRANESQEHIRVLQEENKGLRAQLTSMDDRWREKFGLLEREYEDHRRECRAETDSLHETLRLLQEDMAGLQRQIIQNSRSTAQFLGDAGT